MPGEKKPITYEQVGVDYGSLDWFKRLAQVAAVGTHRNLEEHFGYKAVPESVGESAFVWYEGDRYGAMVTEGLGTKNLAADQLFREIKEANLSAGAIAGEMAQYSGKTYYDAIAQDTVAMIVNDLITVGAMPMVVTAHMSVGESGWFTANPQRAEDLVRGWAESCNLAGVTWGSGETPALKGVLQPDVIELSGSAVGEIYPVTRLTLGEKLTAGDSIILLKSSGIHANGLTTAREIADQLPYGYSTLLDDGSTYGETLLKPTKIYVNAVRSLFLSGVDIHYMANITGHGWRKLMRADRDDLSYIVNQIPKPQKVFEFMKDQAGVDDREMYGNYNMGAGYAVFVPANQSEMTIQTLEARGYPAMVVGSVQKGSKQVIIKPKNIVFEADSLQVR